MSQAADPSFFQHFANIEDPRIDRMKRHQLLDILFIAVCAVIAGVNDFAGMETFGKAKLDWFKKFLKLPNGIPSHDTFGRVFAAIKPKSFHCCFTSWVTSVFEITKGALVNVDGKTSRASGDDNLDQKPLHIVSAWATANRLVLGQVVVDSKSNEITAIPQLLEMLELHGAIITLDAMGCQKEIVEQIREQGADYVITVKANQEHLEEDIRTHFDKIDEGKVKDKVSVHETEEQEHGRQEQRRYEAVAVPKKVRHQEEWRDLKSIVRATRTWQENETEKTEVRYFISSLAPKAVKLSEAIRGHWGIENNLHWVLDMYFGDDRSRARRRHAGENLGLLRRWVLSLLRQDETMTGSIAKKRLTCCANTQQLASVLGL